MADKNQVQFNKTPDEVLRERRERQLSAQQERERQKIDALKQTRPPLGGAPSVKIPPLTADPIEGGGSMSDQAAILADPTSPLSPAYNPEMAVNRRQGELAMKQPGPFNVLPPEAQSDPRFVPGVGSMIAGNQPQMSADTPPKGAYKPSLSDETRKSMEALAEFQQRAEIQQNFEASKRPQPQKAEADEALGPLPSLQEELKDLLQNEHEWNRLNNPERRRIIESRLDAMDLTDIIIHGEIRQTVIVQPGKLSIVFRSVSGEEDLAIKRMMYGEKGGDRYLMDRYTLMSLTLAVFSINGSELPTHLSDVGRFDENKFLQKFRHITKFPIQFLADLGVQYMWFDDRVRDLFVGQAETLKNS